MNKKILLILTILILVAAFILVANSNISDYQLKKEIERGNEAIGELEIEEEFVGPNTNYTREPDSSDEKYINF